MPKAQPSLGEQMALPGVRHSFSWREEESAHVTAAAAKDDDDETMATICSSNSAADGDPELVEGFMGSGGGEGRFE